MTAQHVLVTGGSGFIAGHIVLQLLDAGHTVRTTVRSRAKEQSVRDVLAGAGMTRGDALEFVEADLLDDAGWAAAVAGIDTVVHVASPVVPGAVADEDDVIRPAREGTLRVLRAARAADVRRVVLTSAFHAIGFGHGHIDHVFTEDDWSPLDGPGMDAYGRSKVLAERAAWDFVEHDGAGLELVTLEPVAVMGPVMGTDVSGANHILQAMLSGAMPGFADLAIPIVDVRDVAAAHVAAITSTDAAGHRVLVAADDPVVPLAEIGALLRDRFGDAAAKVPTMLIPNEAVIARAETDPGLRGTAAEVGYRKRISNERLRTMLGIEPRPSAEAILAGASSMLERGLVG